MSGKVLYFIGAGASRAAYARMPLMDSFLELGLEYAQALRANPEQAWPYWKMMGFQEIIGDGAWLPSPDSGRQGFASEMFSGASSGPSYQDLGRAIIQTETPDARSAAVTTYLERLECTPPPGHPPSSRMSSRKRASIEWLLTRAEEFALATDDDRPFHATKDFILWVLAKLEQEMTKLPGPTVHDQLCDAIISQNYPQITRFVSFNYDVLLERALMRKNPADPRRPSGSVVWNPHENYGVGFERFFSYQDLAADKLLEPKPFPSISRGKVNVLKPHGSLYWLRERHGDGWSGPLADIADPSLPALPPPGDSFLKLVEKHLGNPSDGIEPIIIPPSPTKAAEGAVFWQTWQEINRELQECESVVIIGWNMPATDTDIKARIAEALALRRHPIERLLVCDMRKSDIFYQRFVAAFRPKVRLAPWKEGFSERFIKERLVPDIMPKRL